MYGQRKSGAINTSPDGKTVLVTRFKLPKNAGMNPWAPEENDKPANDSFDPPMVSESPDPDTVPPVPPAENTPVVKYDTVAAIVLFTTSIANIKAMARKSLRFNMRVFSEKCPMYRAQRNKEMHSLINRDE